MEGVTGKSKTSTPWKFDAASPYFGKSAKFDSPGSSSRSSPFCSCNCHNEYHTRSFYNAVLIKVKCQRSEGRRGQQKAGS